MKARKRRPQQKLKACSGALDLDIRKQLLNFRLVQPSLSPYSRADVQCKWPHLMDGLPHIIWIQTTSQEQGDVYLLANLSA